MQTLIGYADGEARRFLSLLEQTKTSADTLGTRHITRELVKNALTSNARRFDEGGDIFYEQISASRKSSPGCAA